MIDFDDLPVLIFSGVIFSKKEGTCFLFSIDWEFFALMGYSVKKSGGKNLEFLAESKGL